MAATILHPGSVARERVKRVRQLAQRQAAEGWRVSPVQHGCQSGRGAGGLSRSQPHPAQQRAGCCTLERTGEDRPPAAAPATFGTQAPGNSSRWRTTVPISLVTGDYSASSR